ncbi:MAG: TonB-dependent receptor [Steroidobacteraceae bacterium]|nr:TonB-dependent receptor [Steroidobacteraceae bacterium]
MRNFTSTRRNLTTSASLAALLIVVPAHAQDAGEPASVMEADGSEAEDAAIVVTGSRIARPELDAAVPVAVVGREQIALEGATNVQDILNELPQVGIGTTRTNSNFLTAANGVATIDLRNLGENRTLVLVNGRRFVAGLAGNSAVDVNNIPTDFLERVEVTTGGGSAVYGSDAVAGVVNFILRDSFEGIQVRGQAGITERGDNARYAVSVTGGTTFGADDRGNALLNFSYDRDEGLRSSSRSISDQDCFLNPTPEGPDGCGPATFSSFSPQGRFQLFDAVGNAVPILAGGESRFSFDDQNGLIIGPGAGFNRNAERLISTPVERYLVSGITNFEITDDIQVFAEGTYVKVKSLSRIEPLALGTVDIFDGSPEQGTGIPLSNVFIPAPIQAAITARNTDADPTNDVTTLDFRRRQNEVFDRSNTNDRDTYRAAVGVRGNLTDQFKFEASYVYGRLKDFTASQDIDNARYRNALDSEIGPDGQPRCRSASARADGCVPINLFGFGTASPAASAYVQAVVPKSETITNEQQVASASISGKIPLFEAGPLGIAFGSEYRKEKSVDDLDILTNTGGNSGNQIPDTLGSFDVWEVFGELDVPLLADRPFFHDLRILGAARYSDYSTVGGVFSWNAGAEWAPIPDLRLRGVYAVANRAPNIGELFSAPAETFPTGISDPCEGITAATPGAIATACRAIPGVNGVIAANGSFTYELADIQTINGFDGGNLNLKEEEAKTITVGGVFTPRFIQGLSLTVDYFDIKIKDAIGNVPRPTTITQCLLTGDPVFCANVIRFANTGRLQTINAQLINVADIRTRGIDANLSYRTKPGFFEDDNLNINVLYTHLLTLEQVSFPGGDVEENRGQLDGAGRLGAGFKDKASARVTYGAGGTSFSWQVNYLGKIKDTLATEDVPEPFDGDPGLDALNSVGARFYHDIQLRQRIGELRDGSQFEFFVGVDNLFDKDPPFLPSGFASSITGSETAADTYDPFGRRFYAGAQFRF